MSNQHNLTPEEIKSVLEGSHQGHLGCIQENVPYVYPMVYAYANNVLYGQTKLGTKTEIIRHNSYCCFQVQKTTNTSWESVMVWGTFEELDLASLKTAEQRALTQLLSERIGAMQHQFGVHISVDWQHANNQDTTLWRLPIKRAIGVGRNW